MGIPAEGRMFGHAVAWARPAPVHRARAVGRPVVLRAYLGDGDLAFFARLRGMSARDVQSATCCASVPPGPCGSTT